MQKQYNRGQDGAGLGVVKFDMPAGEQFLLRVRSDKNNAIERILMPLLKTPNNYVMQLPLKLKLTQSVRAVF